MFPLDVRLVILSAKKLKEEGLSRSKALAFLDLIQEKVLAQEAVVRQVGKTALVKEGEIIFSLAQEARDRLQKGDRHIEQILDQIVSLEEHFGSETADLYQLRHYTPSDALAKKVLFRGITMWQEDQIQRGEPLFAEEPAGKTSLAEHILSKEGGPFISLTADQKTAKHFGGKVIAVRMDRLIGHLYRPEEIEAILRNTHKEWSKAKKLQRKNVEFILGPTKQTAACIPINAIIAVL